MAGTSEKCGKFTRGQEFLRPEFSGIDSNDNWVGDCKAPGCHGQHKILLNKGWNLPSTQIMNWWDFLDVLECYEKSSPCGLCTNCNWCKYYFRNLLGEAWGLTWNSWRTECGQFFMAVKLSPHDERYSRRPMTVEPYGRRVPSPEEKLLIEVKERKTLFRLRKKFDKRF